VTECVAGHISIAARKGVDLGTTAQEASEVSGAPADLKIVFANLIDNAVRYTPTGGSVDVSVRRHGKVATVEVADTGCGVEESQAFKAGACAEIRKVVGRRIALVFRVYSGRGRPLGYPLRSSVMPQPRALVPN
jgi:hypothetical protein